MKVITDVQQGGLLRRLYGRFKEPVEASFFGEGLRAKVLRGGTWMGAGSFAEQLTRFARNMILTRLLAPEAFGTMAIVLSAGSVIHTITDIGVKESIIQNPRGSEAHYASAAWWLAFGRSVLLYAAIFVLSPWISAFYGNRELAALLRVVALSVILDGALSSKAYVAMKEMKFGRWAAINNVGSIAGVVITVVLSFFLRGVWALVLGNLAESASRCILSYVFCPYLPSLSWDRGAVRDLLRFSKGLFGLAFLNLIFMRTDVFVLAKLYPSAQLGLYVIAVALIQTPASFVMNLLGQTLLPTFSHIRGDEERVNRILLQVTAFLIFVGMPAVVFMFFCGRSLLTLAYGHVYGAAAAPLIVASCVALVNLLNGQITTVFYSKGLPQLHRRCVIITAILMIVLIYPFVKWFGLVGGQLACLVSIVAGYAFQAVRIRRVTGVNLGQCGRTLLLATTMSLVVAAVCLCARPFAQLAGPFSNVIFGIAGCLLAYSLSVVVVARSKPNVIA